jgi:hypothetical protein
LPACADVIACHPSRDLGTPAWGPLSDGEPHYARQLLPSLRDGMIVLLDHNFNSYALLETIHGTGADFLVRLTANRRLPVLRGTRTGVFICNSLHPCSESRAR